MSTFKVPEGLKAALRSSLDAAARSTLGNEWSRLQLEADVVANAADNVLASLVELAAAQPADVNASNWLNFEGFRLAASAKASPTRRFEIFSDGEVAGVARAIADEQRIAQAAPDSHRIIAATHARLRQQRTLEQQEEDLLAYSKAAAMVGERAWCREGILWCAHSILDHWIGGGIVRISTKLARRAHFLEHGEPLSEQEEVRIQSHVLSLLPTGGRIKVLDVGSCYDPLRYLKVGELEVIALDLQPATETCLQADFLQLEVTPAGTDEEIRDGTRYLQLISLPEKSQHAIVLSLVLSYLPTGSDRAAVVLKARHLLTDAGLLVIVDTLSVDPTNRLLSEWRRRIEAMGFERIRYERLGRTFALAFIATTLVSASFVPEPLHTARETKTHLMTNALCRGSQIN